jgi:hypothetical protein
VAVAHPSEGAGSGRHIHQPPVWARPQQVGACERQPPRPERVRLERLAHDVEIGGQDPLPGVVVDRRVVDEHVQRLELAPHRRDRRLVGHVEPHRAHVAVQRRHRGRVPRAGEHRVAARGELARDLEADAAVGSGD